MIDGREGFFSILSVFFFSILEVEGDLQQHSSRYQRQPRLQSNQVPEDIHIQVLTKPRKQKRLKKKKKKGKKSENEMSLARRGVGEKRGVSVTLVSYWSERHTHTHASMCFYLDLTYIK